MDDYDDGHRRTALTTGGSRDLSAGPDFAWVDPSRRSRRRSRAIGKTLAEYTGGLEVAKRFLDASTEYQKSMRGFELAREQRSLTPLQVEVDRQALFRELRRGQQIADIATADYEIDMLMRQEIKMQSLHRIRRLRETGILAGPTDDIPADLRAPLATEHAVARNREWTNSKIEEIRRRAASDGRQLTVEEMERIDRYQDAEVASEASIRRRGASDL